MIPQLYEKFRHWSETGSVYIISDLHFNDSDCKLMDKNWITPDEQIAIINKMVHKTDTLIVLGDVGDVSYISKLKAGYKVLIMGNHDAGASNYKRDVFVDYAPLDPNFDVGLQAKMTKRSFESTFRGYNAYVETVDQKNIFLSRRVFKVTLDNNLFDEVYEGPLFIGERLLLSHEPIIELGFCYNIHGHDHAGTKINNHLNVAANVAKYTPISLAEVIKKGALANIETIHRITIDSAITKKAKRIKKRGYR